MRSRMTLTLGLAIGLLTVVAAPVPAHHGWGGYDSNVTLTFTGLIRDSGYEHPHGHLRLEVPGKLWEVVLAPPSRMERRGLTPAMLKPGTTVSVVGYPHKTDANEMRAERITVDGKTVELR
jgi:hypothetical protein